MLMNRRICLKRKDYWHSIHSNSKCRDIVRFKGIELRDTPEELHWFAVIIVRCTKTCNAMRPSPPTL